jgi:CRP-like cAMP-binding protein
MKPGTDTRLASWKFAQFLQAAPYHLSLSTDELNQIHSLPIIARRFAQGTTIAADREAYLFIGSGWAVALKSMPNGDRAVIDFLQRGDLITCDVSPDRTSVEAATELTAFEIQSVRHPSITRLTVSLMKRNREIAIEHFVCVSRRPPLDRLAYLFLEVAHRLSQSGAGDASRFDFPFTQRDVADALGLTAIHVNRLLRVLREAELLRFQHWIVELANRRGLIERTQFDPGYLEMKLDRTAESS